jgi:hypothetical protein
VRAFVIMDMLTSPWLSSSPSRIGPTPLNYTRAMWVLTPLPRARCQCQSQRRGAVAGVGWAADVRVREEERGEGEGREVRVCRSWATQRGLGTRTQHGAVDRGGATAAVPPHGGAAHVRHRVQLLRVRGRVRSGGAGRLLPLQGARHARTHAPHPFRVATTIATPPACLPLDSSTCRAESPLLTS